MHLIRGSLVSGTARCRTDCCESSTVCRAPGSAPLVINRWETLRGSRAKDRKQFHKAPVTPESLPLNKDIVTSQQVWNQMLVSSHESLKHLQPFKAQILGTSWCRCSLSWVLGADVSELPELPEPGSSCTWGAFVWNKLWGALHHLSRPLTILGKSRLWSFPWNWEKMLLWGYQSVLL